MTTQYLGYELAASVFCIGFAAFAAENPEIQPHIEEPQEGADYQVGLEPPWLGGCPAGARPSGGLSGW